MRCALRQYSAALLVLNTLLGEEWFGHHILRETEGVFLRPNADHPIDSYKHGARVIALAETLFNLREVEGFEARLEQIRRGDVEASLGELQGACLLYRSGIPFRFVQETGLKGSDYDVEAVVGGVHVPCEMKVKLESTSPSKSTVEQSINVARSQLPSDKPSLVFLRVPDNWANSPATRTAIEGGIAKALRDTGRVSAVIVHWESWVAFDANSPVRAGALTLFKRFGNPRVRFPLPALDVAISGWPDRRAVAWQDFGDLLCEPTDIKSTQVLGQGLSVLLSRREEDARILYRGHLNEVRGPNHARIQTVFEFGCKTLRLSVEAPPGVTLTIDLPSWPNEEFGFRQLAELGRYQLIAPFRILDPALEELDGAVVPNLERRRLVSEALQQNPSLTARDPYDEVILFLHQFFEGLRKEGDMVVSSCDLDKLQVFYRDIKAEKTVFQIDYLGPAIPV